MEALGEQLSAARKKLGLTAGDAAARLRIRTMFVEALEREDWATVGEPVYVRGFLRNYAKLLGLDPALVVAQLPEEPQTVSVAQTNDVLPASIPFNARAYRAATPAPWYPWLLGALTAIAGILVLSVAIGLFGTFNNRSATIPAPNVAQAPSTFSQGEQSTSNTLQANAAAQSQGGVNLRLQLTQPSWLSITVDGKRVVYETLPAGTVREFHGARQISLRAGNAGGVVANFDGKDLGTLGTAGQVEDRVFAAKTSSNQLTGAHE
jgi:cytoskeleton protein RodZ